MNLSNWISLPLRESDCTAWIPLLPQLLLSIILYCWIKLLRSILICLLIQLHSDTANHLPLYHFTFSDNRSINELRTKGWKIFVQLFADTYYRLSVDGNFFCYQKKNVLLVTLTPSGLNILCSFCNYKKIKRKICFVTLIPPLMSYCNQT